MATVDPGPFANGARLEISYDPVREYGCIGFLSHETPIIPISHMPAQVKIVEVVFIGRACDLSVSGGVSYENALGIYILYGCVARGIISVL